MYFPLTNDYESNNNLCLLIEKININLEDNIECYICFEGETPDNNIKKLNSITNYIKNCECDIWIHTKCMELWYDKHKKCPICRQTMEESIIGIINNNNNNNTHYVFIIINKAYSKILNFCWFLITKICILSSFTVYFYLIYCFMTLVMDKFNL